MHMHHMTFSCLFSRVIDEYNMKVIKLQNRGCNVADLIEGEKLSRKLLASNHVNSIPNVSIVKTNHNVLNNVLQESTCHKCKRKSHYSSQYL